MERSEERFQTESRELLTQKPQTLGKEKRLCFSAV